MKRQLSCVKPFDTRDSFIMHPLVKALCGFEMAWLHRDLIRYEPSYLDSFGLEVFHYSDVVFDIIWDTVVANKRISKTQISGPNMTGQVIASV